MLRWLLPDVVIMDGLDISFVCQCSRERVEQTLVSLGQHELERLIEEDDQVEVVCHFCNEAYVFNKDELQVILDQAKS
ncbi:33 kDa chaperonin [compost metagenome]